MTIDTREQHGPEACEFEAHPSLLQRAINATVKAPRCALFSCDYSRPIELAITITP